MKIKWTPEHTAKTISGVIIAASTVLIYLMLANISHFFGFMSTVLSLINPFIVGFVFAYLLNRPMVFVEKYCFSWIHKKKKRSRLARGLSILVVLIITLMLLALLVWYVSPQLAQSVVDLVDNAPKYIENIEVFVNNTLKNFNIESDIMNNITGYIGSMESDIQSLIGVISKYVPEFFHASKTFATSILNVFVGVIICIYMLFDKEKFIHQGKKMLYAIFNKKSVDALLIIGNESHSRFSGFIVGQLLDSLIIGFISFIFLSILQMPYPVLISIIIGATNVIPFFGPFIGAIPSGFIILIIDPFKALIFAVFILVLQQLDGNILAPKIIGDSTGLASFWVIFALLVGGGLWGFIGMLVSVPLFSILFSIVTAIVNNILDKKKIDPATLEKV